jgi:hypothetical protein
VPQLVNQSGLTFACIPQAFRHSTAFVMKRTPPPASSAVGTAMSMPIEASSQRRVSLVGLRGASWPPFSMK